MMDAQTTHNVLHCLGMFPDVAKHLTLTFSAPHDGSLDAPTQALQHLPL